MKMEKPTVKAVRFDSRDVIATSVTLSNFDDGISTNNIFTVGGNTYGIGGSNKSEGALVTALKGAGGDGDTATEVYFVSGDNKIALVSSNPMTSDLWYWAHGTAIPFDGTYTWKTGDYGYAWYKK